MKQQNNNLTHSETSSVYPWIVITLCSAFLFYKYILQVYPSIMTVQLMQEFHVSGIGLGNLAATFYYAYLIMQLFAGILIDRFNPRYLTAGAIACCALGAYVFSHTDNLLVACIARALMGAGATFATVSYMKMVAVWFKPQQFAFVGGLLATAAMLGAIFGQAPLSIVVKYAGWRDSILFCAILGFIICILFLAVVKDKPDNLGVQKTKKSSPGFSKKELLQVLKNKQNWLLTFYSGLIYTPIAVFGGLWGNPFIEKAYNLSQTDAASFISLIFIGLAFGGPLIGLLAERAGNKQRVMLWGALFCSISLSLIIYCPALPIGFLGCLMFLFGFAAGSFMLAFAVAKDLNNIALAATVVALINTGDAILGSITEPLIGKFLDLSWTGELVNGIQAFSLHDYHLALLPLPLYLLIGFLLMCFIKEKAIHKESSCS